jgi:predicted signal transduction protein with EAL and GGDEF domain
MTEVESPQAAEALASRILKEVSSTAAIDGHSLHVSSSIGISLYPENGLDRETLIRYADQAMYAAKESGRDAYRFFSADLNDHIQNEASIEQDLRKALRDGEFFLTYQPPNDGADREVGWDGSVAAMAARCTLDN